MPGSPSTIEQIQQALGPAWQALLTQQYVIGAQQLAAAAVFVLFALALRRAGRWAWARREGSEDSYGEYAIVAGGSWVLGGIVALFGLGFALDGLGHLVNPAGYAVQGIVDGLGRAR